MREKAFFVGLWWWCLRWGYGSWVPCPLFSHFPWRLRAVNEFSDIPSDHRASLNLRAYKRHRFAFGFLIPPSWHWLYNSARLPRQRHVPPFLIGMYFSDPQLSDSKSFFFFPFFLAVFLCMRQWKEEGARDKEGATERQNPNRGRIEERWKLNLEIENNR